MKVRLLEIENFRGVKTGVIHFDSHSLLVGSNNIGKSTVCEALDMVLGPDRLYRNYGVINEHDFYRRQYRGVDGAPTPRISIRVIMTDLSPEVERRFGGHIRRWNLVRNQFVDHENTEVSNVDGEDVVWALPLLFRAEYDSSEDDFVANTYFDHPEPTEQEFRVSYRDTLGEGRTEFKRADKRLCGFIYLRALRTGSRALGLQRGSLLDTILRLGGEGATEMWTEALSRLESLDPSIGDNERLQEVRGLIQSKLKTFINVSPSSNSASFFASNLTREHLREVVQLFITTQPSNFAVPFSKQGTGSINLLVFALLTIIADLKESHSVIFAMEEPEIALPPHIQRRVTEHVLKNMGQAIVTSHSPYIIERFEPESILMLNREGEGTLKSQSPDMSDIKRKVFFTERKQFAEAVLSKAVIVVEGSTESSILPVISSLLEHARDDYVHLDLAGITVFNAKSDSQVVSYGRVFRKLGKIPFGIVDKQPEGFVLSSADMFEGFWESPEKGVERLLVNQMPIHVLRLFLVAAIKRSDFPRDQGTYQENMEDTETRELAYLVLRARKGEANGYAALLMEQCNTEDDLPEFFRDLLIAVNKSLNDYPDDMVDNLLQQQESAQNTPKRNIE